MKARSVLTALPPATHNLAALEAAFNTRRSLLITEVHNATLVGRILAGLRIIPRLPVVLAAALNPPQLLTPEQLAHADSLMRMRNPSAPGHRIQPRDGSGKFLGRKWLVEAERFTTSDVAFFRSPINPSQGI